MLSRILSHLCSVKTEHSKNGLWIASKTGRWYCVRIVVQVVSRIFRIDFVCYLENPIQQSTKKLLTHFSPKLKLTLILGNYWPNFIKHSAKCNCYSPFTKIAFPLDANKVKIRLSFRLELIACGKSQGLVSRQKGEFKCLIYVCGQKILNTELGLSKKLNMTE